jgi:hypothetical protein
MCIQTVLEKLYIVPHRETFVSSVKAGKLNCLGKVTVLCQTHMKHIRGSYIFGKILYPCITPHRPTSSLHTNKDGTSIGLSPHNNAPPNVSPIFNDISQL